MNNNPNTAFTEQEIADMKAGLTLTKSLKDGDTSTTAGAGGSGINNMFDADAIPVTSGFGRVAPRINFTEKVVKPVIKDNQGAEIIQAKVTAPNTSKYNDVDLARKTAASNEIIATRKRKEELNNLLNPEKLLATLNALDRKVRKLEKDYKTLLATATKSNNGDD